MTIQGQQRKYLSLDGIEISDNPERQNLIDIATTLGLNKPSVSDGITHIQETMATKIYLELISSEKSYLSQLNILDSNAMKWALEK